jgi:hypothetical protein
VGRSTRKDLTEETEEARAEIVYCRATKCNHNKGRGKCDIVHRVSGDDKISINSEGVCDNFLSS